MPETDPASSVIALAKPKLSKEMHAQMLVTSVNTHLKAEMLAAEILGAQKDRYTLAAGQFALNQQRQVNESVDAKIQE